MSTQEHGKQSADDVEGHGFRFGVQDAPQDDVEGHSIRVRATDEQDDAEGHGFRWGVVDQQEADLAATGHRLGRGDSVDGDVHGAPPATGRPPAS
jgi:hypothetical protein